MVTPTTCLMKLTTVCAPNVAQIQDAVGKTLQDLRFLRRSFINMNIHLIDGTFELFRAYYAMPSMTSPQGAEVGATRGFLRSMISLLNEKGVSHVGIAFDHVVESFRNDP